MIKERMIPLVNGTVSEHSGEIRLGETLCVCNDGFADWCLNAFMQRTGCRAGGTGTVLRLAREMSFGEEGYMVSVTADEISVTAGNEKGVIWGLTTLACLLEGGMIPCCEITDGPAYRYRGLLLDCSRQFFPAEEVKKIVGEISLAKMNVLHWHLSDDQGWRIESARFPELNRTGGDYYTREEIREVVAYARDRGVEVIPEIDMPGHVSAILAAFPQYSCSGKEVSVKTTGGIFPVIMCAGKEETYRFLTELIDDVSELFPSRYFHIGGDEAPRSEWECCPDCLRKMEEEGLRSFDDLQGYFNLRIAAHLKEKGKTVICWNDLLKSSGDFRDLTIQYWNLQHIGGMKPFVEAGGHWIYSDMFEYYLDYPYSMTDQRRIYETVPHLGGRNCDGDDGLEGLEGCLWTENIADGAKLENRLFPRLYAIAERGWYGFRETDYAGFRERLRKAIAEPLHGGIAYTPENWWEPEGKARRNEAVGYLKMISGKMDGAARKETMKSAAPSKEFISSFLKKFFRRGDLPFLVFSLLKK